MATALLSAVLELVVDDDDPPRVDTAVPVVESVREWREAKEEELKEADILAVAIKSDSTVDERRISIR